jgi:hypothetical protein
MGISDSLHSLLDYERLLFWVTDLVLIYESVTSSASVVHGWTLNSLTNVEWLNPRTKSPGELNIDHHLQNFMHCSALSVVTGMCVTEPLPSFGPVPRLFVAAGTYVWRAVGKQWTPTLVPLFRLSGFMSQYSVWVEHIHVSRTWY